MAEPSIGDSKKKGLAGIAVTGLLAYSPSTWQEIAVAFIVAVIVIYTIKRQADLDKEKKNDKEKNSDPVVPAGG